jgi:hypothetical protein
MPRVAQTGSNQGGRGGVHRGDWTGSDRGGCGSRGGDGQDSRPSLKTCAAPMEAATLMSVQLVWWKKVPPAPEGSDLVAEGPDPASPVQGRVDPTVGSDQWRNSSAAHTTPTMGRLMTNGDGCGRFDDSEAGWQRKRGRH